MKLNGKTWWQHDEKRSIDIQLNTLQKLALVLESCCQCQICRRLSLTLPPFVTTRGAAWRSMAQHGAVLKQLGPLSRQDFRVPHAVSRNRQADRWELVSWCVPCAKKSCYGWEDELHDEAMQKLYKIVNNCIIDVREAVHPWMKMMQDRHSYTHIRVGIIMWYLMHMFSLSLSLSLSLALSPSLPLSLSLSLSLPPSLALSLSLSLPPSPPSLPPSLALSLSLSLFLSLPPSLLPSLPPSFHVSTFLHWVEPTQMTDRHTHTQIDRYR